MTVLHKCLAVLTASVLGLLSGCTISTPFKGPGYAAGAVTHPTPDDRVLVGLTYIRTGDDSDKNRVFWDQVDNVYQNIAQQPGLIGFSIRKEVFGNQGWTMSVWRDEQSLDQFVASPVHRQAMQEGLPALAQTAFLRFYVAKERIPLPWDEAEALLQSQGRGYTH